MLAQNRVAQELRPEAVAEINPVSLLARRQVGQFKLDLGFNIANFGFAFAGDSFPRKAPRHILHAAPLSMHVLTLDLKMPPALFAVQSDGENGSVWKKIGSIASPVKRNAHLVTQPGTIGPTRRHGLAALDVIGRSEEHTSELQSHHDLVCRLLLE